MKFHKIFFCVVFIHSLVLSKRAQTENQPKVCSTVSSEQAFSTLLSRYQATKKFLNQLQKLEKKQKRQEAALQLKMRRYKGSHDSPSFITLVNAQQKTIEEKSQLTIWKQNQSILILQAEICNAESTTPKTNGPQPETQSHPVDASTLEQQQNPSTTSTEPTPATINQLSSIMNEHFNRALTALRQEDYATTIQEAMLIVPNSSAVQGRKWRMIGFSACALQREELVNKAFHVLDVSGKIYLIYLCKIHGFLPTGDGLKWFPH